MKIFLALAIFIIAFHVAYSAPRYPHSKTAELRDSFFDDINSARRNTWIFMARYPRLRDEAVAIWNEWAAEFRENHGVPDLRHDTDYGDKFVIINQGGKGKGGPEVRVFYNSLRPLLEILLPTPPDTPIDIPDTTQTNSDYTPYQK